MASLVTYLIFNGQAKHAMQFYQSCFGGELKVLNLSESPFKEDFPDWMLNATLHASLIKCGFSLYASDLSDESCEKKQNTVFVHCESDDELSQIIHVLKPTCKVLQPLQRNYWNVFVASLVDQFNVEWIFYLSEN